MADLWSKNVCPYMGIWAKCPHLWPLSSPNINIFEWDQLPLMYTIDLYIFSTLQPKISQNVDLRSKNPQKCTKMLISQFALLLQLSSPKSYLLLHFSIFSLEILQVALELHLAANVWFRFLIFDFGTF